jgi:hypothetical protein
MLGFLFDENISKVFHRASIRHTRSGVGLSLDVVTVGTADAPPRGTPDEGLLAWAAQESRILVTFDYSTMQSHLDSHLASVGSSPGVLAVRPNSKVRDVLESLELIAYVSDPGEFADRISWIPLA